MVLLCVYRNGFKFNDNIWSILKSLAHVVVLFACLQGTL